MLALPLAAAIASGVSPYRLASRCLRTGAEQQPRRRGIVHAHGPVQRRRAVGPGGVDVDLLREEGAHGGGVPLHGRVGQAGIGAGGARRPATASVNRTADAKTTTRGFFTPFIRRRLAGDSKPRNGGVRSISCLNAGIRGRESGIRRHQAGPPSWPSADSRLPIPDSYSDRRNVNSLR